MSLFFVAADGLFVLTARISKKTVEKLIRICHTKIMHLEGKEFCTVCAAK